MFKEIEWTQIIIGLFGGGTGVALITHILYKSKLKKERQSRTKAIIEEKIYYCLEDYKNLVEKLSTIEYMFPEELVLDDSLDFFSRQPIYPDILKSPERLISYYDDIIDYRNKHEENLSQKSAVILYCLDRYFLNLINYTKNFDSQQYEAVGSLVINDFHKMNKIIIKIINKEINRHRITYEKHEGYLWERRREKYENELWKESILHKLMFPEKISEEDINEQMIVHLSKALKEGADLSKSNQHIKKLQRLLNEVGSE